MPNIARPSRDCHACRQRRVKCDLVRPECNQCLRKGRSCPGYRNELETRFQIESVSSFQSYMSRDRRRRTRNQAGNSSALVESWTPDPQGIDGARIRPAELHTEQMHHARSVLAGNTSRGFPLQYPLAESWNGLSIPLVINQFSFREARIVFNTIPRVVSKTEEGSALYLACNTVGCAYLTNVTRSLNAISDQARAYGTALAAVNSVLQDPHQYKSNSTLLGVWLLSIYELLWGAQDRINSAVQSPGWDIHSQGMIELVRLRGLEQFRNQDGQNLFWMVFNIVQIQALMTGRPCPKETFTWIHEIYRHCEPSHYIVLRAAIFSYHCTHLCSRIRELVDTGDLDTLLSSSPSILQDIDEVENATHPLFYNQRIADYVVDPPLTPYSAPDHVDLLYLGTNTYQCNFRMQLSYHVLEFLRHASKAPGCTPQQQIMFTQFRHRCIEEFRTLAHKVLCMLAMTLDIGPLTRLDQLEGPKDDKDLSRIVGWSDAIRCLPPLTFIAACPISSDWERDAANKILDLMKRQLGTIQSLGTL